MKEQILQFRAEGKTYNEIKNILGCSKSTISFHCGEGVKEKTNKRSKKYQVKNHFRKKLENFKTRYLYKKGNFEGQEKSTISEKDVIEKIGINPNCYLTGRKIDIADTSSYHFDHIVPSSKSINLSIDNLGIACRDANMAKNDMMLEDFIQLCVEVCENNGYQVIKK